MAATAHPPSHARELSIPSFEFNPGFSFPAQPRERPLSTGPRFPAQFSSDEPPTTFVPRRGSLPLPGTVLAPALSARPRSSQVDALSATSKAVDARGTSPPSPESPDYTTSFPRARPTGRTVADGVLPTVLNATLRMGAEPDKTSSHNREASELLQVPMLEQPLEEKEPAPIQKRAPPPPGVNPRRGHVHRRSGAISSSDVWSLMNQTAPPPIPCNGSTARASTAEHGSTSSGTSPTMSWSAPSSPRPSAELLPTTPNSTHSEESSDTSDTARRHARVCFTEDVEIIPRPLSIGTESSSTATVTESSVTKGTATRPASPPSPQTTDATPSVPLPTRRPHNRTRSNSQTLAQPTAALRALSDRPSTAGAILSSPQTMKPLDLNIPEVPSLKRPAGNLPFLDAEFSPVKRVPSKKSHKKAQSDFSPLMLSNGFTPTDLSMPSEGGQKKKKGKKQIKNWAGNILGKGKLKHPKGHKKSKRAPTPPISRSAEHLTPGENEWVATSWNESYVIMPVDTLPVPDVQKVVVDGGPSSPVIDLDAALSPFKMPMETHTGFAAARRRMHSAASRGNGSYFHRRSESMPEMQLFALEEDEDRAMEDVFEEEEAEGDDSTSEEEESSEEESDDEEQMFGGDGLGIGIQTEDAWPKKADAVHVSHAADASHKRLSTGTITAVTVSANAPIADNHAADAPSSRRKGAPADIITPQTSDEAVNYTATGFRHSFIGSALDSPSTFVTATSSPNTPIQGEFSGDDSTYSFDPYRDYLGEPGPEMRMSADDIPSLTSSSSIMTMNAIYAGMPSTPGANEIVPAPITAPKEKKGKSKRWSRVFTFWRSK